MGVVIGTPFFKLKELIQQQGLTVFSANFALYTALSRRVMQTLKEQTDQFQAYSIDEAFLSMRGLKNQQLFDESQELKRKVETEVGVPVGVGVAPTKVLAKLANHRAKKNPLHQGVCLLQAPSEIAQALKETPINDVWGIGRQSALKMQALNIRTAYEFAYYPNEKVILKNFTKTGLALKHELMGQSVLAIESKVEKKDEVMCSRSFGHDVYLLSELQEAVATFATLAAQKIRAQDSATEVVEVFIRTNPFKEGAQYSGYDSIVLGHATMDTFKIIAAALTLLKRLYRPGLGYKKAGVRLCRLSSKGEVQLNFLEVHEGDTSERLQLMAAIDAVNTDNGPMTLKSAACGTSDQALWKMLQQHLSQDFLSRWHQLPRAY